MASATRGATQQRVGGTVETVTYRPNSIGPRMALYFLYSTCH